MFAQVQAFYEPLSWDRAPLLADVLKAFTGVSSQSPTRTGPIKEAHT